MSGQRRPKATPSRTYNIHIDIEGFERSPDMGGWTLWSKDKVAVVMPTPAPSWGPEMRRLYALRIQANFSDVCPSCSATSLIEGVAPKQSRGKMEHEYDCPLSDEEMINARVRNQ